MKKHPAKISLTQRVLAAVLAGEQSAADVVQVVGRYISAAQATNSGRQYYRDHAGGKYSVRKQPSMADLLYQGRRRLVCAALGKLKCRGKITRVSKGRYGPPLPRLFNPAESA